MIIVIVLLTHFYSAVYPGLFSDPFYNDQWPEAIKFGFLGTRVAEKIADYILRLLDSEHPPSYVDCLIEQRPMKISSNESYIKQFYTKVAHRIALTSSAVETIYQAYKQFLKKQPLKKGLLINAKGEMFYNQLFISAAQAHCYHATTKRAINYDLSQIDYFRVNHAFMNDVNFARVFNCRPGSPMYSLKHCKV